MSRIPFPEYLKEWLEDCLENEDYKFSDQRAKLLDEGEFRRGREDLYAFYMDLLKDMHEKIQIMGEAISNVFSDQQYDKVQKDFLMRVMVDTMYKYMLEWNADHNDMRSTLILVNKLPAGKRTWSAWRNEGNNILDKVTIKVRRAKTENYDD